MDCPDTCTLDVTVEDGKIKSINGNKANPVTNGFICSKVSKFAQRVYSKDRILYPLKRVGKKGDGNFERISWDEAIQSIAEKYQKIVNDFGGEAILPYHYGGSNGLLGDGFLDDYFFAKVGASRLARTICATPTSIVSAGMYGKMPGVAFPDYQYSKFILIWGANPKSSHIHLTPFLKKAKNKGAFIAVIDPYNNFTNREIDLHLPVLPGTDLPVALSMINYWKQNNLLDWNFINNNTDGAEKLLTMAEKWDPESAAKMAGINSSDLVRLAEKYAETNPAVLRCGWGIERNRNGGQAVAAILSMPALLGKFGMRGAGYTMSNSGAVNFDNKKVFSDFSWNSRILNMAKLGQILESENNPPIKSLFVYNCNPVATVPDQNAVINGLSREDLFTVVHEQVKTDTTRYADIILPAVTFLEQNEIKKSYGNYLIGKVKPVINPVGESKPNEEVFAMLGRAMHNKDEVFQWNTETLINKVVDSIDLPENNVLAKNIYLHLQFKENTPIQFKTVFPGTKDRRVNLNPSELGKNAYRFFDLPKTKYPLLMISPASNKMTNSTMGEFNYPELFVTINLRDANDRQIKSNDFVKVFNGLGEIVCKAKVNKKIRSGVVLIPKGAWRKSSKNGKTSVALCPATTSDVGGGACYSDSCVEIIKLNN